MSVMRITVTLDGHRRIYSTLDEFLADIIERAGPFRGADPRVARDCVIVVNAHGVGAMQADLSANTGAARTLRGGSK